MFNNLVKDGVDCVNHIGTAFDAHARQAARMV